MIIGSVHLIFKSNYYNFVGGFFCLFLGGGELSALLIMSRQIRINLCSASLHILQETNRPLNIIERCIHYNPLQMHFLTCHSFSVGLSRKPLFLTENETGEDTGNLACLSHKCRSFCFS